MDNSIRIIKIFIAAAAVLFRLWAADTDMSSADSFLKLSASGSTEFEILNLVKSNEPFNKATPGDTFFNNTWIEQIGGTFALEASITRQFDIHFGLNAFFTNGLQSNQPAYYSEKSKSVTRPRISDSSVFRA